MGRSATAIITYGIAIEEDDKYTLLPWHSENGYDGDLEEWWKAKNDFQNIFELYDKNGNYLSSIPPTEEEKKAYYEHSNKWLKKNPIPITEHFFGYEANGVIVASNKAYYKSVDWDAESFDPATLIVKEDTEFDAFVAKYLPGLGKPQWLLAAKYY